MIMEGKIDALLSHSQPAKSFSYPTDADYAGIGVEFEIGNINTTRGFCPCLRIDVNEIIRTDSSELLISHDSLLMFRFIRNS